MFISNILNENTKYEVLISTFNEDGSCHIKPFGLEIENNFLVLNLFPNKTLFNIKNRNEFKIYFSQDILLFTEALLNQLDFDNFLDCVDCEVVCDVVDLSEKIIVDAYCENAITKIKAEPIKIIEHKKTIPLFNRASNQILELLIDFSRFNLMDIDAKDNFIKKIESSEIIIEKTGNDKHKKSLNLIKKEVMKK
jgi:hypothetical protein